MLPVFLDMTGRLAVDIRWVLVFGKVRIFECHPTDFRGVDAVIISKETAALLRGEYGATPAPVNPDLQKRVLNGKAVISSRPADHLEPEMDRLRERLRQIAAEKNLALGPTFAEDVLTYALFPDVGLRFLENRGNPAAFEPRPD